jgi:hypothetical protein
MKKPENRRQTVKKKMVKKGIVDSEHTPTPEQEIMKDKKIFSKKADHIKGETTNDQDLESKKIIKKGNIVIRCQII